MKTWGVDELSLQGDHAVPGPAIGYPGGLVQVVCHQSVPQGKVEGRLYLWFVGSHQVKQAWHVLWPAISQLQFLPCIHKTLLHSIQFITSAIKTP